MKFGNRAASFLRKPHNVILAILAITLFFLTLFPLLSLAREAGVSGLLLLRDPAHPATPLLPSLALVASLHGDFFCTGVGDVPVPGEGGGDPLHSIWAGALAGAQFFALQPCLDAAAVVRLLRSAATAGAPPLLPT
ncbi:MAG: hypothetical protein WCL50_14675, partial [Spirochaetota bacterium]